MPSSHTTTRGKPAFCSARTTKRTRRMSVVMARFVMPDLYARQHKREPTPSTQIVIAPLSISSWWIANSSGTPFALKAPSPGLSGR